MTARNPPWILKVSRLESLTDGIFAIAMTILVLNVGVSSTITAPTIAAHLQNEVAHKLFIYAGSFIILGTYWVGMNFQLGFLERVNRLYLWANIFFLMFVCVLPFSASLLGNFRHAPLSICFYAFNIMVMSLIQLFLWWYARLFKLNAETVSHADIVSRSIYRRICVAPFFYIAALLLTYWNTDVAFIALVAPPLIHIFPGAVDRYAKK